MSDAFGPAAEWLGGMAGAALGWAPAAFWAATPAELGAVVRALTGEREVEAADRATLARLMEAFPDG